MKLLTGEWLRSAEDDLNLITKILSDGHLTHMVAFHAQQSIEKTFKAVLEEKGLETPKIHNLTTLFGRVEQYIGTKPDMDLLKTLDQLYVESRYPGELGLLPNGKPDQEDAKRFFEYARNLFRTISELLTARSSGGDSV